MMRLGLVEYINALPFHLPFRLGELSTCSTLTYAIPSELNCQLRTGKVDIALTSCTEYFDQRYKILPNYGIGAHKAILSVNLYLRGALQGARIAVTHHSATSVSLLKVLCHCFWGVAPDFVPMDRTIPLHQYEGFLLIGDEALAQLTIPGYQTIDLAEQWYEATHLPFVFAVFLYPDSVAPSLASELEEALRWSETHHLRLIEEAHKQTGLPHALLNRYYQLCQYRLGDQEWEGLNLFKKLRERVPNICT